MARQYKKIKIGAVFGAMTVIAKVGRVDHRTLYAVRCVCGNERVVGGSSVRVGSCCKDCGSVAQGEARRKSYHPHHRRLYCIYRNMLRRCNDTFNASYKWYGGKGVKVKFAGFGDFKTWAVARGYRPGLSIERKSARGDYEPSNCEWITKSENTSRAQIPWRRHDHFPIEMLWGMA